MSKIFIPQHLKKLPVISDFYKLLDAYETENPLNTINTYLAGNAEEVITRKKEDPVYYFIWYTIEKEYNGVSLGYLNNIVTYLTKLFYSVKGTRKVFEYMESRLFLSFSSHPDFEDGNIVFQLDNVAEFSDSASTNFNQALINFLNRLLYFRKSQNTYDTVKIEINETFNYSIQGDLIPYKIFTVRLENPSINPPLTPPQQKELFLCNFDIPYDTSYYFNDNGTKKFRWTFEAGDEFKSVYEGIYVADNYEGNNAIEINLGQIGTDIREIELPSTFGDKLYVLVGVRGDDQYSAQSEMYSIKNAYFLKAYINYDDSSNAYYMKFHNKIEYAGTNFIAPSGYYGIRCLRGIELPAGLQNYITGWTEPSTIEGGYPYNYSFNVSSEWSTETTRVDIKPSGFYKSLGEIHISLGFDSIPVSCYDKAEDWYYEYMKDKEFYTYTTKEGVQGDTRNPETGTYDMVTVKILNISIRYKE